MTSRKVDRVVKAEYVASATRFADMPKDGLPEVAVVGRSNVGKSSLINALVNRRRLAHTSGTPGKTQVVNFYMINGEFYLVDLPGLGYAKVSRTQRESWGRLIRGYVRQRASLKLVVHLIDSRREPAEVDLDVASIVRSYDRPYLVLLTKVDKLSQRDRTASLHRVRETLEKEGIEIPVVATSAVKKQGLEETWGWIDALVGVR